MEQVAKSGCKDSKGLGKIRGNGQERNECLLGGFNDHYQQQGPGRVLMQTASEGRAAWEPLQTDLANSTICGMIRAREVTGPLSSSYQGL